MPEPHDDNPHLIRTTRTQIEAQMMAGTYCTAADDITEKEVDMSNESEVNPYNVRVGQVWVSTDSRDVGLKRVVLKIEGDRAQIDGFKKTWVRLNRFKPSSSGYRLVRDVK